MGREARSLFETVKTIGAIEYSSLYMRATFETLRAAGTLNDPASTAEKNRVSEPWNKAIVNFKITKAFASILCGPDIRLSLDRLERVFDKAKTVFTSGPETAAMNQELSREIGLFGDAVRKELQVD